MIDKEPPIKGVFLSTDELNGQEAMISLIRLHLPCNDPAELALKGCAYWIIKPEGNVKEPNTVLIGAGRQTSHDKVRSSSWNLLGGNLNAYDNPNVIAGFYTYSGFFVSRKTAMWCSAHIEKGLKSEWSRRSSFTELQSDGVRWNAHADAWKSYQKELAEKASGN